MLNQWQQMEVDEFEKIILKRLFGRTEIPDSTAMILKALRIDPNHYIREFEERIEPFLKETGECDGQFLKRTLKVWKPGIARIIDIPEQDFRLQDFADTLLTLVFGHA